MRYFVLKKDILVMKALKFVIKITLKVLVKFW
jgi:hypothetical protein